MPAGLTDVASALPAASPAPTRRVLLVDDHAVVREGLRRMLETSGDVCEVIEAGSGEQALEILQHTRIDAAVVDLTMPGMNGLELTRRIKDDFPSVGVLMLSLHAEAEYALRAFRNGANGYLTKTSAPAELLAAVRRVAAGGTYITVAQGEQAVRQLDRRSAAPREELSDREADVLRRLVAGERPKEIARALNLSIKTVSTHKARIQAKLQLPTTAALIRYGIEHDLGGTTAAPTPPR